MDIFPQLKRLRYTHRWSEPVSVPLGMAPGIGFIGEEQKAIVALGCIGHGVSMTTHNGRTIAKLIAGASGLLAKTPKVPH